MIEATQLTNLTCSNKDKIVDATREVIGKNQDDIENTLLRAAKNCANYAVYTFSTMYDLEPAGITTSEQISVFEDEVHKYFQSLGFEVKSWRTWPNNVAFEVKWPE